MPFGHAYAPGMFQRTMGIVISSVMWKFAIGYFDDIMGFSQTINDHMYHLKAVLTLLKYGGLTPKLWKRFFSQDPVEYLGNIVIPGCLHVTSKTCRAVP